MKILFLTTVLPGKRTMGSEVASQAVIDAMLELGAEVTTLGYVRPGQRDAALPNEIAIAERPIETCNARLRAPWWYVSALIARLPYSAAKYQSRAYVVHVHSLLARQRFDVVIIDHAQLAWLTDLLPQSQRVVAMVHNTENAMYRALAQEPSRRAWVRAVYAREAHLIERLEHSLTERAQEIWALTEADAEHFSQIGSSTVRVLTLAGGNGAAPLSSPKLCDVALIGSWAWRANRDGLDWFLNSVYPHLPAGLSIHVAGGGAQWLKQRYANVEYHGFVRDAHEFLANAKVVAIPTLSGGGIQIKTLDAIAAGSRIVATPVALRGISNPPSTVTLAHTAAAFAHSLRVAVAASHSESDASESAQWTAHRRRLLLDTITTALGILKRASVPTVTIAPPVQGTPIC